ncbi:MAG: SUF system NifU family Fe-S cluster assembly protein [Rhodospirillales bacterium]
MRDDLRQLYQQVILDHSRSPRNFRRPAQPTCEAHGNNPMCGDALAVFLVVDDHDVIADAAFEGQGCAISLASASLMTEILKGRTVTEAERLFDAFHRLCTANEPDDSGSGWEADARERLAVFEGVRAFPVRIKCATQQQVKAALALAEGELQ